MNRHTPRIACLALALLGSGCIIVLSEDDTDTDGNTGASACGPDSAVVAEVIDGDTVILDDGTRVRYLLVDTPEVSGDGECWGAEATTFNRNLVEGQEVQLSYDVECTDQFGRTLAYVSINEVEVNRRLVERGHACVLHIPPNGNDRVVEFTNLQAIAESEMLGMWGACAQPCD